MSDLPSWARVGAKVVCIDQAILPGHVSYADLPPAGRVVEVTGIVWSPFSDCWNFTIAGYPNPMLGRGRDIGWRIARFRPVTEFKSDDEIEARLYRDKFIHARTPEFVQ